MLENWSMEDFFHLANELVIRMGFKVKSSVYRDDIAVFDAHMAVPGKPLHYIIVFFKRAVVNREDILDVLEETIEVRWMFITTGNFQGIDELRSRDDITFMNSSDFKRLLREFGLEEELRRIEGKEVRSESTLPSTLEYESLLQWAEDFLSSGNLGMALDYVNRALGIKKTSAGLKLKARILGKMGRKEEAAELIGRVIEGNVEDDEAWFILGELVEEESPEDAEAAYARCLKFNPRNIGCWLNRGNTLLSLGKYKEALLCYDRAIAIRDDLPTAWNNRGIALKHLGRYEDALRSYNMALKLDGNFKDAYLNKAILYFDLKRYEEAHNFAKRVLEIDDKSIPALLLLARVHIKRNMENEAKEILSKVLSLDPLNQEARELMRRFYPKATLEEPVEYQNIHHILYEEGKLAVPDSHAYNTLGLKLMEDGEYDLAAMHFRIALKMNPEMREAKYNLAKALMLMGKKKEAEKLMKELKIHE